MPQSIEKSRRSKVARLPVALREEINRLLDDGVLCAEIAKRLNRNPAVRAALTSFFDKPLLDEHNISVWRSTGYADWTMRHDALEASVRFYEASADVPFPTPAAFLDAVFRSLALEFTVRFEAYRKLPDGPRRDAVWQGLVDCANILRRSVLQTERLDLEGERVKLLLSNAKHKATCEAIEFARESPDREAFLSTLEKFGEEDSLALDAAHYAAQLRASQERENLAQEAKTPPAETPDPSST